MFSQRNNPYCELLSEFEYNIHLFWKMVRKKMQKLKKSDENETSSELTENVNLKR